ncbi:hypothetical protein HHK36_002434 [Tetracentron sinense]|uniref:Glycosyltransferase n=1 Tax=Tetracentron sinense TaxID=13715 RepID=A0A834ZQP6_TETSI|nr:hypothetical protein HHK36_002434 [Tetracentron sinense]
MKPHVAILPSPGMGHIIPFFELAKRLVTHHGFHVSLLVITTGASAAQTQLLHSSMLPDGLSIVDLPPVDVSGLVNDDMGLVTRLCLIARESIKSLPSLLIDIPRLTALVVDPFCSDAFNVADELGIPKYSFFTASAALLAFLLHLPTLDREVEGEYVDLPEPVQVPGCKPIPIHDLLDQVRNRKIEEYRWLLQHARRLPMAQGILVNTCEDLEPVSLRALGELQQIPTPPVYPVGPLIIEEDSNKPSEIECLTWLDMQPPDSVLFVSFGSGGTLSAEQLTELAWGLELSQQRFIWVARKPAVDAKASGAFFNVGGEHNNPREYLPDGFLKRTHGVGLVVPSWAPQVEVLSHASTGGFLSHCGWNSTLESIVHGVPIVAWPLYAEQRTNATMLVEDVGVAVRAEREPEKGVVGREEIERVVRLVMDGEEGKAMRSRVKELQKSAVESLNEGGSSYNSLSQVAKEWKSRV